MSQPWSPHDAGTHDQSAQGPSRNRKGTLDEGVFQTLMPNTQGNVKWIGLAFIDEDSDGNGSTPDIVFTSSSETTAQV